MRAQPLRILITALGGEGGGTLMNWLVAAAREAGLNVQATSVPGVAQRTGSTSYYLEVADSTVAAIFNLMPMPGRVDIVLTSELVEAARVLEQGYISPDRTVLIASRSRVYATAEKIKLGDGRYQAHTVEQAVQQLAKEAYLLDLQQLADDNATYISATMYGAIAASSVLPWSMTESRQILETQGAAASLRGFDAAVAAMREYSSTNSNQIATIAKAEAISSLPVSLTSLMQIATDRLTDYQDMNYADLYQSRLDELIKVTATNDSTQCDSTQCKILEEAARRLANWMAYEDIARVADLKTRRERFDRIRAESKAKADQIVRVTEYLKPRAEEIADMLPVSLGTRVMRRVESGQSLPFLGRGRRIPSNAAWGYWLLRATASLKRIRQRSLRYQYEQEEIERWLANLATSIPRSADFALALAELPRLRKGYSDTLQRGLTSYRTIYNSLVTPAIENGNESETASALKEALDAALRDDNHVALKSSVIQFKRSVSTAAGQSETQEDTVANAH